jgi:hypothetical protein
LNKEETNMSEAIAAEEDATSVVAGEANETAGKSPPPDGPPDLEEADFAHILHWGVRQEALKEYRRTIREFRTNGSVLKKAWKDFAHLVHRRDYADEVLKAHLRAVAAIDVWQEEREEQEQREEEERERQRERAAAADEAERLGAARQRLIDQIAARGEAPAVETVAQPEEAAEPEDRAIWVRSIKDQLCAKIAAAEQAPEEALPAPATMPEAPAPLAKSSAGRASRWNEIAKPQSSHAPYVPASTRARAASISAIARRPASRAMPCSTRLKRLASAASSVPDARHAATSAISCSRAAHSSTRNRSSEAQERHGPMRRACAIMFSSNVLVNAMVSPLLSGAHCYRPDT